MLNQTEKAVLRENGYVAVIDSLNDRFLGEELEIVGRGNQGLVFVANRGTERETFVVMPLIAKNANFDGFEDVEDYMEKIRAKAEKEDSKEKEG